MTTPTPDPNWQPAPAKKPGRPRKQPRYPARERVADATTIASKGKCQGKCPVGYPCCCDGEIRHELHICSAETCGCHSAERYEADRLMRGLHG